jgi:chloride channel 3/4/5
MQAWIVLSIVGISSGMIAFVVESGSLLLFDWRSGYCQKSVFYTKAHCCLLKNTCDSWIPWTFSNESINHYSSYFYTFTGVLLALASCFLTLLHPSQNDSLAASYYAAGSGVAEIKTILGGFCIKQCLGLKTLFVKTVSLN